MKTLQLTISNHIGILEKLSMVFTRNRVNVEIVELYPLEESDESRIVFHFDAEEALTQRLLAQLLRIVEVKSGQVIN